MTSPLVMAFVVLYRFLLRRQLSVGRVVGFLALGLIALSAAVAINRGVPADDRLEASVGFTTLYGLGLMAPVLTLVLASASLGELVDDETLVYIWHRPTPRWLLAATAWAASVTVALPFSVIPLTATAAIASHGDGRVTTAVAAATVLCVVAYGGLFLLLGLVFRRALIWGLIYLFIWEAFVARVGQSAARLSIGSYPTSLLSERTGIELPMADRHPVLAVIIPVVVAVAAVAWTGRRLDRIDVA